MNHGNILLTRSDTFFSRAIRRFNSKPAQPALVSHAGLFVSERLVIEALAGGVKTTLFPDNTRGAEYLIFSPELDESQRNRIAAEALRFSARRYGWTKILGQYLDWLTSSDFFTSKIFTLDNFPICSYVVAGAYAALGLDFGVPSKSTTPDDILDFCVKHLPRKYRLMEGSPGLIADVARVYAADIMTGKGERCA